MNAFLSRMKAFLVNDDGPTATEYAVMLALIIVVCLVAITALGTQLSGIFGNVTSKLAAADPGA